LPVHPRNNSNVVMVPMLSPMNSTVTKAESSPGVQAAMMASKSRLPTTT
jgi:hypothetical protein